MYKGLPLLASALALTFAGAATAQTNLEKLSSFQATGTPLAMETIDQTGDRAAQLRRNLEEITLPPGFKIDLYAIVPDARHIAVAPQGTVTFVGTRKTQIWAVTDRDSDRVADEVKQFAPSIEFKPSRTASASPRTASCTPWSRTGFWCSRRPSSSSKGRMWPRSTWWPRVS